MRIIIIRHGETDWNCRKKTQGMQDTNLNEQGVDQSERLAQRLCAFRFEKVFTSPLRRAMQTAEIIARQANCGMITEDALKEIHFGSWEGLTFDEIGGKYPDELQIWNQNPRLVAIPGGESIDFVAERVEKLLAQWYSAYAGRTIVAVSHSVPAKLLVALSVGFPIEKLHSLRMDNASMSVIDCYRERNVLRLLNDTSHLLKGIASWRK